MQQVTAAQSPLSQSSLAMYQREAALPGNANAAAPQPKAAEVAKAAPADGEIVSLHSSAAIHAMQSSPQPMTVQAPEVFAEIWKDGMRVGSVYTDGRAVTPGGGVLAGGSGSAMAYIQAQEISRMVGGEVRYVDMHALRVAQTRTQLRAAYGA